jgi:hypothetical protein
MAKNVKATSIKAAAAILKDEMRIDGVQAVGLVRRAKDGGCLAFDQRGCVDMAVLKKWIGENKDALSAKGDLSLKDQKLNEEIRKLKIANDKADKLVVSKSAGKTCINACVEKIRHFLEQKLENEYPSAVAGMDVPQARVYGRRVHDQIVLELQKLHAEWEKI